MVDNSAKSELIDQMMEAGVTSISVDGVSTSYQSRADMVAERRRLVQADTANSYTKRRRVMNINLGGF